MTYSNGASGLAVREMFGSIAPRYDIANSVLSMGIHHFWRSALVKLLPASDNKLVLDLCTGTGDLLPLLKQRFGQAIGADFCMPMLQAGVSRRKGNQEYSFPVMQADALSLPFCDNALDVISVAFGVRNFENLEAGLREIKRVLKPGGHILVLEFGQPFIPGFALAFRLYSQYLMPLIGGILTGNRAAYSYLPRTAAQFPCGQQFQAILSNCGFQPRGSKALCGGIAYAYCAEKIA